MAAEMVTPVDEIGMPLPIAPTIYETSDASQPKPDWHHHFHPRRSPLLNGDDGGEALRNVRLQLTDWNVHHNGYHGYYEGPPLPTTPQQRFGLIVLAAADYVPADAIDFSREEPKIITLSPSQRERLWKPDKLRMSAPTSVRKFLIDYMLGQNLTDVDEKLVDQFLNSSSEQRRHQIGEFLLDLAIEAAVEPLDPFYRTAWKKGFINHSSASRPKRFIKTKIGFKKQRVQIIERMYDELAA